MLSISIYVPIEICPWNATDMPHYANQSKCKYEAAMSVYLTHMDSMQ